MRQQKDAENLTAAGNCTDKPTRIKSTGIIRRVDELGRIVIPMSIRQTLGLNERDPVEIFMDGERISCRSISPPAFSAAVRKI